MAEAQVGSVVVVDNGRLSGIFSERDVMLRVVLAKKDPERTLVEQVMTTGVQTIPVGTNGDEALRVMVEGHIRHVPVVTVSGQVQAMASMRNLLQEKVEELNLQLDSLESYITADGIGG